MWSQRAQCVLSLTLELPDELISTREFSRRAKERDKIDAHSRAIEIARGAEQMHLEFRFGLSKRRARAEIHHSAIRSFGCLYHHSIYTFRRKQLAWRRRGDIHSRKSEIAASSLSVNYYSTDCVWASKSIRCAFEISTGDCSPNRCGGHMLSVSVSYRLNNIDLEVPALTELAQHANVSRTMVTETVIVANQQLS